VQEIFTITFFGWWLVRQGACIAVPQRKQYWQFELDFAPSRPFHYPISYYLASVVPGAIMVRTQNLTGPAGTIEAAKTTLLQVAACCEGLNGLSKYNTARLYPLFRNNSLLRRNGGGRSGNAKAIVSKEHGRV
jgi:hypothetical protein